MTTQAHPPSEAQQLRDARIANDQLRVRLAEQEALVAQERARAEKLLAQLKQVCAERDQYGRAVMSAATDCTALEHKLAELRQLARDLDASVHGDGNGRCWCGAKEADALRAALKE